MKKLFLPIMTAALLFASLLTVHVRASAAGDDCRINVTDPEFGAVPNDGKDDTDAIQAALRCARTSSTPITVYVPNGTYLISNSLMIFSDTTLQLSDRAILKMTPGNDDGNERGMMYAAHLDASGRICSGESCKHTGYTQAHDITVTGGTWDRNDLDGTSNSSVLIFRHANNISITDTTMKNATNHMLNISGDNNVLIDHVTFKNSIKYTGKNKAFWCGLTPGNENRFVSIEMIHLDIPDPIGESSGVCYPLDGTPSRNVTVQNCTFSHVFSGVGTHHSIVRDGKEMRGENIIVKNNTFTDLYSYAVYAFNFDNIEVSENTVTRAAGLIRACGATGTVKNNTVDCSPTTGYTKAIDLACILADDFPSNIDEKVTTPTALTCTDNTLNNNRKYAFYASQGAKLTLRRNTVTGTEDFGLYVKNGSSAVASSNVFKNTGNSPIRIDTDQKVTLTGNTLNNSPGFGMHISKAAVTAKNNIIKNAASSAVRIDNSAAVTMSGDTISSPGEHGIFASGGASVKLTGVTLSDAGSNGVYGTADTAVTVNTSTVSNSGSSAIRVNSGKLTAADNTITTAVQYGIYGESGTTATLKNNSISDITGTSSGACGDGITVKKGKLTAENNTVSDTFRYGIWAEGSPCTLKNNTVTLTKSHAIFARGSESAPITGTFVCNTASTSGAKAYDIKLESYIKKAKYGNNTLGTRGASFGSTVTFALTAPSGVTAAVYSGYVRVSWNAVENASSYRIYRSDNGSAFTLFKTVKTGTVCKDTTATVNAHRYSYKVKALTAEGAESVLSAAAVSYYFTAPAVSISNKANDTVITWNKVPSASGYYLYRSTDNKTFSRIAVITSKATLVKYTDTTAVSGKGYYYKAAAYKTFSSANYAGVRSAAIRHYRLNTPELKSAASAAAGMKLKWSRVSSATGYRIFRKESDGTFEQVAYVKGGSRVSYTDKTAVNGVRYSYKITSCKGNSDSDYSAAVTSYYLSGPALSASNTASGIKLSWNTNDSASGYMIYRSTDGKKYQLITTIPYRSKSSYTDGTVKKGITYYYKAAVYKRTSANDIKGAFSTPVTCRRTVK